MLVSTDAEGPEVAESGRSACLVEVSRANDGLRPVSVIRA